MPLPYLEKLHKKTDIPLLELERIWDKCKVIVEKQYPDVDTSSSKYWSLVTTVFKSKIKGKTRMSLESFFALEDNNSIGEIHTESELCYIGYMENSQGLMQANRIIEIDQYVMNNDNGQIRVRKYKVVYPRLDESFLCTIKTNETKSQITVCDEINEKISKEFYDSFINLCNTGARKVRYVFSIKDVKVDIYYTDEKGLEQETEVILPKLDYEVDTFKDQLSNEMHNWVKIDIELDHVKDYIKFYLRDHSFDILKEDTTFSIPLNILPIKITGYFNSNDPTPEQQKIKNALYDKSIFKITY